MTTTAYHHASRTIAVDSRTTSGGLILTDNANKIMKKDDLTFILSGKVAEIQIVIDAYPEHDDRVTDVAGFVIQDGKAFGLVSDKGGTHAVKITYNDAFGGGFQFALGAMDHGKGAEDAVKYAMTRDAFTGGMVQVIKLDNIQE